MMITTDRCILEKYETIRIFLYMSMVIGTVMNMLKSEIRPRKTLFTWMIVEIRQATSTYPTFLVSS